MRVRTSDLEIVFNNHLKTVDDYWRRFGKHPNVDGRRILDFGCGTGGMVQRLMESNAAEVVGIDIAEREVKFGNKLLRQAWGDRARLVCADIRNADLGSFDMIISQNTLEHVTPLYECVRAVVDKARPGAEMYFGFCSLWHSPYGSHHYPPSIIPWRHLILGEDSVLRSMSKATGYLYKDVVDAGFNKAAPDDFFSVFARLPADIVSMKINIVTDGWKQAMVDIAKPMLKFGFLRKYLTFSIYIHMRRY
jgi:2-polyprenyl-3-methyl-5-hydroxy-6-metoxy-1,4-benzoquinol methylase